ncbi:DUF305 domain-containing protein [Methylobacterium sp. J-070]|uniref:DUF305 domain-containing protein n=1 Tax=Methylobacterium sp. J-070 TaxID=2836650 RepID=UPI001FB8E041|nr:DUF305 domain-containing protein [Methylobacterium sp. J-070]MCJ2052654.1 DUF305 domain-containing protein [Methylobacterium sp. J-070]
MRHLGLALCLGLVLTAGPGFAQRTSGDPAPPHHMSGPGPGSGGDTPAVQGFKAAHGAMMRAMAVPYTGDPDVDFRLQMIPHHQGAIGMAQVALDHAKDPWTRQLAEAVIVEQQREIAEMAAWLTGRGVPVPPGTGTTHILRAGSYRSLTPEAGTRAESRGQSWAPGAGIR